MRIASPSRFHRCIDVAGRGRCGDCARCHRAIGAAARSHQAAAGLRDRHVARVPNARAHDVGRQRHAVRRTRTQGRVYALTFPAGGLGGAPAIHVVASGPARARRRRVPRWGALRVGGFSRILRFDDIEARLDVPAVAGRRHATRSRPTAITAASSSRSAPTASSTFRSARRATSAQPDPDRYANIQRMNPDGSGPRGRRARRAQLGRLRLGPAHEGALVHRQRPRHAGRRRAARYAQPSDAGAGSISAIRIATAGRSPIPSSAREAPVQRLRRRPRRTSDRMSPRSACGSTRAHSFQRRTATRSSSPSTVRGTAATRSAIASAREARRHGTADRVRAVRRRLAAGRVGVGAARRRAGRARRIAAGGRRFGGGDLPHPPPTMNSCARGAHPRKTCHTAVRRTMYESVQSRGAG